MISGRRSLAGTVLGLSFGLALAAIVGLAAGATPIELGELWAWAAGRASPATAQIVESLRLPRVLGAALVGGALSVSGVGLQAVLKSPLADPYLLGVSAGAALGAGATMAMFHGLLWNHSAAAVAIGFAGAAGSVAIVLVIARRHGRIEPVRLLLAGVAFSSVATSLLSLVLFLVPEAEAVRSLLFWLIGGFSGLGPSELGLLAASTLPAALALFASFRAMNALLLGDDGATALGVDVARARILLIALSTLAASATVAVVGAIGFVGLVVPHAARWWIGPEHRRLLPVSFLFGALLLVVMDSLARVIAAPRELPVGVMSGLVGGPFFLALLRRSKGGLGGF